MTKSVTFTGHRYIPQSKRNDLCAKLEKAVMENYTKGVRNFLCGMAVGFDLLAAEAVLKVKKELPDIILTAVVPFRLQYERWSEREKLRYHFIISRADKVVVLSEHYYNGCLLRRNDYMLSHCNGVIAYYDGTPRGGTYYTVRKARQMKLPVLNLF